MSERTKDQADAMTDDELAAMAQATIRKAGRAVEDVLIERVRQDGKWGEQNHAPEVWLAILSEEVGELATAMLRAQFGGLMPRDVADMRTEAVQVAAVAVAFIEYLDRDASRIAATR